MELRRLSEKLIESICVSLIMENRIIAGICIRLWSYGICRLIPEQKILFNDKFTRIP